MSNLHFPPSMKVLFKCIKDAITWYISPQYGYVAQCNPFFFYENQNLPQSEMLDLKISLHALHLLEFVAGVDNAVFLGLEFLFNKFRELVHQLSLHQSHNHYNYKLEWLLQWKYKWRILHIWMSQWKDGHKQQFLANSELNSAIVPTSRHCQKRINVKMWHLEVITWAFPSLQQ